MKDQASINAIHARYNELSGRPVTLTMTRIFTWESFLAHGWTEADLALVVNRLKTLVAQNKRYDSCLLFSRLIADDEFFEEILSEARALYRVPKPNHAKAEVLKATARTEPERGSFQSAEQVLASPAFKALLAVRDGGAA